MKGEDIFKVSRSFWRKVRHFYTQMSKYYILVLALLVSCGNPPKTELGVGEVIGNWYFIDKQVDSLFYYHEVYIDTASMWFSLGGIGLLPTRKYHLKNDSVLVESEQGIPKLLLRIKKAKEDSLWLNFYDGHEVRPLVYIRLRESETGPLDYSIVEWREDPEAHKLYKSDRQRRFTEYLAAIGMTSNNQLDSAFLYIPSPEPEDE